MLLAWRKVTIHGHGWLCSPLLRVNLSGQIVVRSKTKRLSKWCVGESVREVKVAGCGVTN